MRHTRRDLREQGRIILAHGEVTGHTHEILTATGTPGLTAADFFEVDGRRELLVLDRVVLTHPEHAAITLWPDGSAQRAGEAQQPYPAPVRQGDVLLQPLSPGCWQHIQQRELSREVWHAVAD